MREVNEDEDARRRWMRPIVAAALLWALAGCSGSTSTAGADDGSGDDGLTGDVPGSDGDADADADGTDDGRIPWDVPPAADVVGCGNGILEDGEECDDRNRLNGDGCDWLCRLGDGDPPPDPDPDVAPYEPSGDPIPITDIVPGSPAHKKMPLVWTGSEFATALYELAPDDTTRVRFRRFDRAARPIDLDWVFDARTWRMDGLDMAWTGDGYGLFYVQVDEGIYYLRLDRAGKPMGAPVLVEPDPFVAEPAVDVADGGFVLAWLANVEEGGGACWGSRPPASTRLRLVGIDGSTSGPPLEVDSATGGAPDVATGDDGFGVAVFLNNTEYPECATRFVHVSADLTRLDGSGVLSNGHWPDVKWVDGRWVQAWWDVDWDTDGSVHGCVAHFAAGGVLDGPPVCNDLGPISEGSGLYGPRLAAGDGGLALVSTAFSAQWLFFLRTDLAGRAVGGPADVFEPYVRGGASYGGFNTVWATDGFAVLFIANPMDREGISTDTLFLQLFTAVP